MAKTPNVRNIQLSDDIVLALLKQGLDKGFKNFKSYAEHILTDQALQSQLHQLTTLENELKKVRK